MADRYNLSQSSLKRVLVSNLLRMRTADSRWRSPVAILFEASPGFQRRGRGLRDISGDWSQSSLKRVLVSNIRLRLAPGPCFFESQSSLKRVLVSNSRKEGNMTNLEMAYVAILFEASPGFQHRPTAANYREGCCGSQSSLKRVLVSNAPLA